MESVIDYYNRTNAFGKLLGMEFKVISEGHIEYYLTINPEHLATENAAHGGVLAGFMDAILGVAALSVVQAEGKRVATLEFKTSFFEPALTGDRLTGTGKVIKRGNKIIFSEGEIHNQNGKLVAKGNGTFTSYLLVTGNQ